MLRATRHWFTARTTEAAVWLAPHLSAAAVERCGRLIGRVAQRLPVVARNVAANMQMLGVGAPAVQGEYFRQVGAHFAGALHALRCVNERAELLRIAAERVDLGESLAELGAARASGRGVILIGPHIANYLLSLTRLNQAVPVTVYLRHSKDARRRAAKARWYAASGVGWISEAADAGGALGRIGRMAAALEQGRVLFITPDLPQKQGEGTPVAFFGREIYLPAGPGVLAVRSGAPLFMLVARQVGGRQELAIRGPYEESCGRTGAGRVERRAAVQRRMQWFASELEQFVRAAPALWYLWGDKRWTRLLQGDRRYARLVTQVDLAGAT